ncbi:MAG: DNA translocase FtsK [Planctomycetota bacterium]|nr:DNA translocase FtsK [Planctomycetota bacterium]
MKAKQSKEVSAAEWLGLFVLFLPGSFFVVVLGAALFRGVPDEPAGTSALARDVMNGIGLWPALLLSVGFAVVGIRTFLFGGGVNILAAVWGLAGCVGGLAVFAGAASEGAGGALGTATGGLLAGAVAPPVGMALGAVITGSCAWFAWIRDLEWFSAKTWNFRGVSAAPRKECADAVTADEAEALLPTRKTYEPETDAAEGTWQEPSSPYPVDVRLVGGVPEGANLLDSEDGFEPTSTSTSEVASVQQGDHEDGASSVDTPDAHLAAHEAAGDAAPPPGEDLGHRPADEELSEDGDGTSRLVDPTPPPPSWEQAASEDDGEEPGLYDEPESEEDAEEEESEEDESEELEDAAELEEEDAEEEDPEEGESEELEDAAELEGDEEGCERDLFGEPIVEEPDGDEPPAPDEREVVLEPQAAPEMGNDLLVEAGCLFLERERVAVSMLQRTFDLSFDQSCRVLDELQERGLIGPYMGGKSREILMSREEWMALTDGS